MLDFPDTPTDGQQHVEEGRVWTWKADPGVWFVGDAEGEIETIVANDVADPSASWAVFGDTMVQWGFSTPPGAVEQTVTFPVAFKNSCRVAANNNSQSNGQFVQTYSLAAESFTCVTRQADGTITSGGVTWIAMGEAPDDLKQPKELIAGTPAPSSIKIVDEGRSSFGNHMIVGSQLIQWGVAPASNNNVDVTFPVEFGSVPVVLGSIEQVTGATNSASSNPVEGSITTTGFTSRGLAGTSTLNKPRHWMAIGDAPVDMRMPTEITVMGQSVREFHDPTGVASWRIIGRTLECWGRAVTDSNGDVLVTFPKTFGSQPRCSVTASQTNTTTRLASAGWQSINSQEIDIRARQSQSGVVSPAVGSVDWYVIGEWDGIS